MNDTFLVVGTPAPPPPKFNVDRFASSALTWHACFFNIDFGGGRGGGATPTNKHCSISPMYSLDAGCIQSVAIFRPSTDTQGFRICFRDAKRVLSEHGPNDRQEDLVVQDNRSQVTAIIKKTRLYKTFGRLFARWARRRFFTKQLPVRSQACLLLLLRSVASAVGQAAKSLAQGGPSRCAELFFGGGRGGRPKRSPAFNVLDYCFWADITRYMRKTEKAWETLTTRPMQSTRTA